MARKKTAPKKTVKKQTTSKRKPTAKNAVGKKKSVEKKGVNKSSTIVMQTVEIRQKKSYEAPIIWLLIFPFWGILKIGKRRPTLVIDETTDAYDKQKKKMVDGFVHREATSQAGKNREKIFPNPDTKRSEPMYLKRPTTIPKRLIAPNDNNLNMPEDLRKRYEKNNKKE